MRDLFSFICRFRFAHTYHHHREPSSATRRDEATQAAEKVYKSSRKLIVEPGPDPASCCKFLRLSIDRRLFQSSVWNLQDQLVKSRRSSSPTLTRHLRTQQDPEASLHKQETFLCDQSSSRQSGGTQGRILRPGQRTDMRCGRQVSEKDGGREKERTRGRKPSCLTSSMTTTYPPLPTYHSPLVFIRSLPDSEDVLLSTHWKKKK